VAKNLFDVFPVQNSLKTNVFSPLLFNFPLEYAKLLYSFYMTDVILRSSL
jgi:hypothetical protein